MLRKQELQENEQVMERVNEAMEEHNRENHELKAKCKFLLHVYRREVESEDAGSVSEYREEDEVDVLACFETM